MVTLLSRRPRAERIGFPVFLFIGLLLLVALLFPPHVAARCFGVPEGPEKEATWHLTIDARSANRLRANATLGLHPEATDGFDESFDIEEPLFSLFWAELAFLRQDRDVSQFLLIAYFFYPDAGGGSQPSATAALSTSIIPPRGDLSWPLQVAYLRNENTTVTLSWDTGEAAELVGYQVELITPSGTVPMTSESKYVYEASVGIHDFVVRAFGGAEEADSDSLFIIGVLAAYAVAMFALLTLRFVRKRRQ